MYNPYHRRSFATYSHSSRQELLHLEQVLFGMSIDVYKNSCHLVIAPKKNYEGASQVRRVYAINHISAFYPQRLITVSYAHPWLLCISRWEHENLGRPARGWRAKRTAQVNPAMLARLTDTEATCYLPIRSLVNPSYPPELPEWKQRGQANTTRAMKGVLSRTR